MIHGHSIEKLKAAAVLLLMLIAVGMSVAVDAGFKMWLAAAGRSPGPAERRDYRAFVRTTRPASPMPLRIGLACFEYLSVICMFGALLLIASTLR